MDDSGFLTGQSHQLEPVLPRENGPLLPDGLTNMVDDEKLEEILSEDCTEEEYAGKCIEEALFYGGLDNIAVVIARNRSGR